MEQEEIKRFLNTPLGWVGQETQNACEQLDIYLTAFSDHIKTVRDQYRLKADSEHRNRLAELDPEKVDPADYETRKECEYLSIIEKEWYEKTKIEQDREILQIAWNSFVVCCWATYEMYFERLADYVRGKKGITKIWQKMPKKKDGRHLTKPERLHIYFTDILRIRLHIGNDDLEYLGNLYSIRNAIAHCNGSIDGLFKDKRENLKTFLSVNQNIELVGRNLQFGNSFAAEAMAVVVRSLKEINNSVRNDLGYFTLR